MGAVLWPTELSRHSWPPRNRTARYLRIRQAPSTSWVVASGEGESRTRKAEAQLLSGQIPSPIGLPLHADGGRIERPRVVMTRPPFPTGHIPPGQPSMLRKAGDLNAAGLTAHRLAGEPGTPVRFTFRSAPRTRTEITQGLDLLALPLA